MFSRIQNSTFSLVASLGCFVLSPVTEAAPLQKREGTTAQIQPLGTLEETAKTGTALATAEDQYVQSLVSVPPAWLAVPFVLLLLMIATGPLLYARFWHRHHSKVAMLLAALVLVYYLLILQDWEKPVMAFMEYVQFVALIAALYMASGGILIAVNKQATPLTNLGFLFIGAIIANVIGTTGASMLLIRPYMRLNQHKVRPYHIVFFIFIVSNIGGALTPIGDPPLFLGFLSGVPFFWTLQHHLMPWLVALSLLGAVFYYFDTRKVSNTGQVPIDPGRPAFHLVGKQNFIWFAVIIGAVFIDPNLFDRVPALRCGRHSFSFVRELILLAIAWLSYRCADRRALQENAFNLAPFKEVAALFVGIFGTMIPALQLISNFASSEAGHAIITHNTLYWGAGILSSVLDNAPTYLNFGAASMAAHGVDITSVADVRAFAAGSIAPSAVLQLRAISTASVFFGAMTYVGNGPNFMVKAIAEDRGLRMPSFFTYVSSFSAPILLPVLVVVWLLFFASL